MRTARATLSLARLARLAVLAALAACGDSGGEPPDSAAADSASSDTASDAAADVGSDTGSEVGADVVPDATLAAGDYCESIVDSFCDYYVRCQRMAVPDVAACRPVFLETCNARYEPLWADLAARGDLALSASGIAACADHLADVACEQQIFDLDLGCAGVWQGLVPAHGACGPGLESFVCAAGTTCVLGLDFCGTCVPLATGGEACDLDHRCRPTELCVDGACVARRLPGEPCDADHACVLGAACSSGTCRADAIVAVGDACDQTHDCPYKSACVASSRGGQRCVETHLLGEPCDDQVGCASGFCDGGTCAALGAAGAPCDGYAACTSGRCSVDTCAPITFSCVDNH